MAVIGLDRLRYKLTKKIPERVKENIRQALEQSANEVVAIMRSLSPSRRVAATINWTWGEAPKGAMVLLKSKSKDPNGLRITIYAGDESTMVGNRKQFQLARLLEFGTAPHANKGKFEGSQHPGTAAQPFFYPGWRAVRGRVKGRVTRAIKKAAKEVAS